MIASKETFLKIHNGDMDVKSDEKFKLTNDSLRNETKLRHETWNFKVWRPRFC